MTEEEWEATVEDLDQPEEELPQRRWWRLRGQKAAEFRRTLNVPVIGEWL